MIKYLFLFVPIIIFPQTTYQNGYKAGFEAGYCHGKISGCVAPIAPIGPVDIKNDYQTGYNNGFVAGKQQQTTNNSGGAYGQLKPVENKVGDIYQNMVNDIITNQNNTDFNQAWDNYYWRKEQRKQDKENDKNNLLTLYDKEFSITNEMIILLEKEDNSTEQKYIIEEFNKKNFDLIYKYRKTKNFKGYFKKLYELRKEIQNFSK